MSKAIFWFRRDLRLEDNTALNRALAENDTVIPIFIFDELILNELPKNDPRISFIYQRLSILNETLRANGSGLLILKGDPVKIWAELLNHKTFDSVYSNRDYEPYANERDNSISALLKNQSVGFYQCKTRLSLRVAKFLKIMDCLIICSPHIKISG